MMMFVLGTTKGGRPIPSIRSSEANEAGWGVGGGRLHGRWAVVREAN
jgi:hypothetical protein